MRTRFWSPGCHLRDRSRDCRFFDVGKRLIIEQSLLGGTHVRAAIAFSLLLLLPSVGHVEARIALLICNEAYAPAIGALTNPHNDVARLGVKALPQEVSQMRRRKADAVRGVTAMG